jgi:hypothetical protein
MAEERRRKLDLFSYEDNEAMVREFEGKKSWLETYLDKTKLTDLEDMSKQVQQVTKPIQTVTTNETQKIKKDISLPLYMQQPNFKFGKSTGCYEPGALRINPVIDNIY